MGLEEEKFENSEKFDKTFLIKKYPGLSMPNVKNTDEIDLLDIDDLLGES